MTDPPAGEASPTVGVESVPITFARVSLVVCAEIAAALAVAALSVNVGPSTDWGGIAGLVFSVSGTMVALALPSAQLADQAVRRELDYWPGEVAKHRLTDPTTAIHIIDVGERRIDAIHDAARFAWHGCIYVSGALIGSLVVLLTGWTLRDSVTIVVLATSCAALVVGAFLFLPFAYLMYNFKVTERSLEGLRQERARLEAMSKQKSVASPASETAQLDGAASRLDDAIEAIDDLKKAHEALRDLLVKAESAPPRQSV